MKALRVQSSYINSKESTAEQRKFKVEEENYTVIKGKNGGISR